MGLFKRRSRVPDLQAAQYDAVVAIFLSHLNEAQRFAQQQLVEALENAPFTEVDLTTVPRARAHGLDIVRTFTEFALLPLPDVYVMHSHSPYLTQAALFTDEVQRVFQSDFVQSRVRIFASQGISSSKQTASLMHDVLGERLRLGGTPNDREWAMSTRFDAQVVTSDLMLSLLTATWLDARTSVDGKADVLGLACGWILLQWLEWSAVTPEAMTPPPD